MCYYRNQITIEERKNFYRITYQNGIYSLEKLIEIYEDYEKHERNWRYSTDYGNFLAGQRALLKVIEEIKAGILN